MSLLTELIQRLEAELSRMESEVRSLRAQLREVERARDAALVRVEGFAKIDHCAHCRHKIAILEQEAEVWKKRAMLAEREITRRGIKSIDIYEVEAAKHELEKALEERNMEFVKREIERLKKFHQEVFANPTEALRANNPRLRDMLDSDFRRNVDNQKATCDDNTTQCC